jgi:hypothetical protein
MQADRSAGEARTVGSVRGLGVCDVLRIELDPVQRAGLELQLAARVAALERRGEPDGEELRLLARMRARVPASVGRSFVLVGPAGLVVELVGACLAAAVAGLHARLGEGAAWSAASERDLATVAAWIATALDCQAVEGYSFEPGVDPVHAW